MGKDIENNIAAIIEKMKVTARMKIDETLVRKHYKRYLCSSYERAELQWAIHDALFPLYRTEIANDELDKQNEK